MLRYLKWVSVAGVWLPILVLALWAFVWSGMTLIPTSGAGVGMIAIGLFLVFGLSHALAISSFIGVCLLVTRRTSRPTFTLVSAIIGGTISAFVLARVYFDIGL